MELPHLENEHFRRKFLEFPLSGEACCSEPIFSSPVTMQRNTVQHPSASTRTEPNFLASESFL